MRTLGLALVVLLLCGCMPLHDLPFGAAPRIGYVDHGDYVHPDGRRTDLPREIDKAGVSGIVPYDGGFLVSDERYFEGSVGLWFVRDGKARDLPGCSTGTPRLVDGWVWWVTAACLESGDLGRPVVHRAQPDGSHHTVRVFRPVPGEAIFLRVNRYLARMAPLPYAEREDREHRLKVVLRRGRIAVIRIDSEGNRELATPVARFNGMRAAYVLGPGR